MMGLPRRNPVFGNEQAGGLPAGAAVRQRWLFVGALALTWALAGLGHGEEASSPNDLPLANSADDRAAPRHDAEATRDTLELGDRQIFFYRCRHRPAEVVLAQLQALVGDSPFARVHGATTTDVRTEADRRNRVARSQADTLVIEDTPARIRLIREMLARIDVPNPQVLLDCRIIEIQYSRGFQLGASFDLDRDPVAETFFQGFMLNYEPSAWLESLGDSNLTPFQGASVHFGNRDFPDESSAQSFGLSNLMVRALQQRGRAEILANPRLLVQEDEAAQLHAGEDVYIQSVESRRPGQYTFRSEAKSAGINLDVRPVQIGPDSVRMRLYAAVREITGFTQATSTSVANPIISSRTIDTLHTVNDGVTVVIGGLILNESRVESRAIPILGDIPLLGELFRNHDNVRSRSEVIFIITPHIVYDGIGAPTDVDPADDFAVFEE